MSLSIDFSQKTALVTGASQGIGKCIARTFNRAGATVVLNHPIGCSGARVLVTLLHVIEDNGWNRGIASLCIGGGMGIAMAIKRS